MGNDFKRRIRARRGGRMNWEIGIDIYTLLLINMTNESLLLAQGVGEEGTICRTYIVKLKNVFQHTLGADKYSLIPLT